MNLIPVISLVTGLIVGFLFLLNSFLKERAIKNRELSRANCLVQIFNVLNLPRLNVREKMKQVGRRLADEGDLNGWRCRIVLHEDPLVLPPDRENLGAQIPLSVDGKTIGALLVTALRPPLSLIDQHFFQVLAESLALFIWKEKMWNDFHAEVERLQASLLLNTDTAPTWTPELLTVEHMLQRLGAFEGKVENPIGNKL